MYLKDVFKTKKNISFKKIVLNSKDIQKGDLFIPFGGIVDRNTFILDALDKKCSCIITDKKFHHEKIFYTKNLETEIIAIFNKYYNYPLKDIKLIGITGTDGKTTMASILSNLLNCPNIGTNGFLIENKVYPLPNTTPPLDILYNCFDMTRNKQFKNVVMEVSSEAYLTKRIGSLPFDIAIFTNITKEHLDKHKTFANYLNCKLQLIKNSKIAILNKDSKYYYYFKDNVNCSYSYGFKKGSDLRILYYKLYFDKTFICFKYKNKKYKLVYPLLGKFNVYNTSAAILTMLTLGFSMEEIFLRFKNLKQVPGRMEIIKNKNYFTVLDYAHTTNATYNVLKFFKKFNKNIITVVGCAGERYKEKRKEIGNLVLKYSKFVIFTSDDPRYEDPLDIIAEMIGKSKKTNYISILDRKKALEVAFLISEVNDLLLILGKGRDNYMLIKDKKIKYSDYDEIIALLKEN